MRFRQSLWPPVPAQRRPGARRPLAGQGLSESQIQTVRNAIAVVYTFARTDEVETMPRSRLRCRASTRRPRLVGARRHADAGAA
jgi:hypothetical protein